MGANLLWKLTGGATNADPDASLGGTRSSESLGSTPKNNLFDNVKWQESIAGRVEYRALDLVNEGDQPATEVTVWLADSSSPDTSLQLGPGVLESTRVIGDETTPPATIVFGTYAEDSRLEVPDIPVGQGFRVWFQRTVDAGAANTPNDLATLSWEFA